MRRIRRAKERTELSGEEKEDSGRQYAEVEAVRPYNGELQG